MGHPVEVDGAAVCVVPLACPIAQPEDRLDGNPKPHHVVDDHVLGHGDAEPDVIVVDAPRCARSVKAYVVSSAWRRAVPARGGGKAVALEEDR